MVPGIRIQNPAGFVGQHYSMPLGPGSVAATVYPITTSGGSSSSWVPEPGVRANLGTDTMVSKNAWAALGGYSSLGNLSNSMVWCGMVYAEHYGTYGSIIFTGGGHADYAGNEVYAFDLETLTWRSITIPGNPIYADGSNLVGEYPNGEMWVDAGTTTSSQLQPVSAHVYDAMLYIPPGLGGAGSKGYLVSTARPAMALSAAHTGQRTHALELSTVAPHQWFRFSANLISDTGVGARFPTATLDPVGVIYMIADSENSASGLADSMYVMPLTTKVWQRVQLSESLPADYQQNLRFMQSHNLLMYFYGGSVQRFKVIDPSTGQVYSPTVTGTPPTSFRGGDWCESLGRYAHYAGDGSSTIYWLAPPTTDPRIDPWTWTTENFTGPTPPAAYAGLQHYSRLRWVPRFNTLLWLASPSVPMQAWTPRP